MKNYKLLIVSFILFSTISAFGQEDKAITTVKNLLQTQSKAWNEGNIDAFMETYWKSDKLQFIGSSGITYGWEATLDGYKKRYPNRAAMGELTFEVINVEKRNKKIITLVGKFYLKRTIGDLEGIFLLVCQKIKGKWVIIMDQTC